ncbi:Hpt domain-containing protein, partial [Paracoccus nototheniae]|uniref:Hpt domain-containing protein n=2 Tax=Paracoccus nototheniae TaxID=2489002 RepID=UPI0039E73E95
MTQPDANQTFLAEARDLLEQLEGALLDLETRPDDQTLINTTFRALHTLKGSGGMFGPPDMAAFAHHLEDAFETVRQGSVALTPEFVGVLLRAAEQLRRLLFEPAGDHGAESGRMVAALEALTGKTGSGPATPAAQARTPASAPDKTRSFAIDLRLPPNALLCGTNPLALLDELRGLGTVALIPQPNSVPPLADLRPTDLSLTWHIELITPAGRDAIEDVFIFVDDPGAVTITESRTEPDIPTTATP